MCQIIKDSFSHSWGLYCRHKRYSDKEDAFRELIVYGRNQRSAVESTLYVVSTSIEQWFPPSATLENHLRVSFKKKKKVLRLYPGQWNLNLDEGKLGLYFIFQIYLCDCDTY